MNRSEKQLKLKTRIICKECELSFGRTSDLRKHVKHFHPAKFNELVPPRQFSCNNCSKTFDCKKDLTAHFKTHASHRKCPLCPYESSSTKEFHLHFINIHNIDIRTEVIHLAESDFDGWKSELEKETKSHFVLERGSTKSLTRYYKCHRSGSFKSKGHGLRHIKTQGSNKMNGFCPARMKTTSGPGEKLTIYLTKTHVGHQCDLGHLSFTSQEHRTLVTRIASKVPFDVILDEIRDSITNTELEVHMDARTNESENIYKCIKNASANKKSCADKKRAILVTLENISLIISNDFDSDDDLEAVERLINPIKPTLAAIKASRMNDFCGRDTATTSKATPLPSSSKIKC